MLNPGVWNSSSCWCLIERRQCLAFFIGDVGENRHVQHGGMLSNLWPPLFTSTCSWIICMFNNLKRSIFINMDLTFISHQQSGPWYSFSAPSLSLSLCFSGRMDWQLVQTKWPPISQRKANADRIKMPGSHADATHVSVRMEKCQTHSVQTRWPINTGSPTPPQP